MGYINEDFMQESILKKISEISSVRSDLSNYYVNPTPEDRSRDKKNSPKISINYLIFGDHGTSPIVSLKDFSHAYKWCFDH